MNFYQNTLNKLLKKGLLKLDDNILVVAAGQKDKETFYNVGFRNVIITNLNYHEGFKEYSPFQWKYEDAEALSFDNNTYDWVFVHSGLHHCASPHTGLCEMLRVAKKGVGVFESRDSLFNAIANKLGVVPSYEIEPCVLSNGKYGGLRNSPIPNYVYKWTESEVKKTTKTYLPQYSHRFHFFYGLLVPTRRLAMSKNIFKKTLGYLGKAVLPFLIFFFKKQGNLFAFIIEKNIKLHPWLKSENNEISFNLEYARSKFNPNNFS